MILDESPGDVERASIIGALRSSTGITHAISNIEGIVGERVAANFEIVQDAFRGTLTSSPISDPNLRTAILSIPAIFPSEEALELLAKLRDDVEEALNSGVETSIKEDDLLGVWIEVAVGGSDVSKIEELATFLSSNPGIAIDDSIKLRSLDIMSATTFPTAHKTAMGEIARLLKPRAGPDSAYVKWLEVRANIEANDVLYQQGLAEASGLEIASVIHFGTRERFDSFIEANKAVLVSKLEESVNIESDPETIDFLNGAIVALSEFVESPLQDLDRK